MWDTLIESIEGGGSEIQMLRDDYLTCDSVGLPAAEYMKRKVARLTVQMPAILDIDMGLLLSACSPTHLTSERYLIKGWGWECICKGH